MSAKENPPAPLRGSEESAADQDHRSNGHANGSVRQDRAARSFHLLRALAYLHLQSVERADALDCLRLAQWLVDPPAPIRYGTAPDLAERRRRALEPRPGDFPGFGAA